MLNSIIPGLNFLQYNGGQIAYRESGEGPTIVLFHGMNEIVKLGYLIQFTGG